MKKIHNCVELLPSFFEVLIAQDWKKASSVHQTIIQFENEADELKHDFRRHLRKSLLLPIPRGDFLALLAKQDKIANTAKDIAGIIIGRRMEIPLPLVTEFKNFLNHCVKASEQAQKAINKLDELLASGFRRKKTDYKQTDYVDKLIDQLNNTEYKIDQLKIKIRQSLFQTENILAPVNVIFLYKIIEQISFLTDHAQQTDNHLQLLTAD
ncbi:TIGR00153 family protein [Coxiella-like endosymbiont]|uniref:TIGR00153 family protein n=1 Tax=Coxiella-like endosymbiont TaxID=1592897 RepID=UPI00272C242F|nr:TIGR00153 family protein [Coxiella-like endosymbiont]